MVMDSFSILDINNKAYKQPRQVERLRNRIVETITGKLYLTEELEKLASKHSQKSNELFNVAPRIIIDNVASTTDTLIEANGRDRVGFLYEVTSAINLLGLKINSAHITTYGEHVVDTFYVKDLFGLKVTHRDKIEHIRRELLKVIHPTEFEKITAVK